MVLRELGDLDKGICNVMSFSTSCSISLFRHLFQANGLKH